MPERRLRTLTSSAKRVLPMPGSPLRRASEPLPRATAAMAAESSASSRARPMNVFFPVDGSVIARFGAEHADAVTS